MHTLASFTVLALASIANRLRFLLLAWAAPGEMHRHRVCTGSGIGGGEMHRHRLRTLRRRRLRLLRQHVANGDDGDGGGGNGDGVGVGSGGGGADGHKGGRRGGTSTTTRTLIHTHASLPVLLGLTLAIIASFPDLSSPLRAFCTQFSNLLLSTLFPTLPRELGVRSVFGCCGALTISYVCLFYFETPSIFLGFGSAYAASACVFLRFFSFLMSL